MTSCRVCICAKHLKMSQGGLWEGPCQSFGHISREASAPAWAPWLAMPAAHGQCPSVGGLAQCQSLCPHHSRFLPLGPDTRHGVSKHTRTSRPRPCHTATRHPPRCRGPIGPSLTPSSSQAFACAVTSSWSISSTPLGTPSCPV